MNTATLLPSAATQAFRATGGHREVTDEDRAHWLGIVDMFRDDPELVTVLEEDHPELLAEIEAGVQSLAIEARSVQWRNGGARPEQLIPGTPGSFSDRIDWAVWLLMGGRGSGKSRTGAEATREMLLEREWTEPPLWALVGQTLFDVRTTMLENTLLQILPDWSIDKFNRSTCELWLTNGAYLRGFSSDAARSLRGLNFHGAWCFPAEAPVSMADGSTRPIASLAPGDMVASTQGPTMVTGSGMTRADADVWVLPLDDGTTVEATADHQVWVSGRGWVPLAGVLPGDTLELCTSMDRPPGSNTKTFGGTGPDRATISPNSAASYTDGFTPNTSAPSLTGSMSTTSTETKETLTRATLRRSPGPTISRNMGPEAERLANTAAREPLPCGRNVRKLNGSASIAGRRIRQDRRTAGSVASFARAVTGDAAERSTPTRWAKASRSASQLRTADVYDISTESGEFYAYGVRVHNCDELATWTDASSGTSVDSTTWSNLKMAVRAHDNHTWTPRIIGTTTPRPVRLIRNPSPDDFLNPGVGLYDDENTVVSNMSTWANKANLSAHFLKKTVEPLRGTRLWEQEVEGKLVDEVPGSLWKGHHIDRMLKDVDYPDRQGGGLSKIVVGVDPSVGEGTGDECGIVVAGLARDMRAYVLEDASVRGHPSIWAKRVVDMVAKWGADLVVAEVNNGGELVVEVLGQYADGLVIPVRKIRAKKNKKLRAEPIAVLSDADRIRFAGPHHRLAWQMTTWNPEEDDSPDRVDAFVYAMFELLPIAARSALVSTSSGAAMAR